MCVCELKFCTKKSNSYKTADNKHVEAFSLDTNDAVFWLIVLYISILAPPLPSVFLTIDDGCANELICIARISFQLAWKCGLIRFLIGDGLEKVRGRFQFIAIMSRVWRLVFGQPVQPKTGQISIPGARSRSCYYLFLSRWKHSDLFHPSKAEVFCHAQCMLI